jgi:threonyl-tRNA synthetase
VLSLASAAMATAEKIQVKLPDGSSLELDSGATGADAAAAIGSGLAKAALVIKVDGELRDLATPLEGGEQIEIVTDRSPEALELIRHDAAHVLAESVLDLWPDAKISIGPPIENGFYYDIEFPDGSPGEEDLARIEERMAEHVKADEPFERRELPAKDAIELFRDQDQDYKVELIEDLIRDEGAKTV